MTTEKTENNDGKAGEVFYDGHCPVCVRAARRFSGPFIRRGFEWVPMQTPGTSERLHISDAELASEMKLLLPDGRVFGGIDTWICLLRSVWWLWPIAMVLRIPGIHFLAGKIYRLVARNRYCLARTCRVDFEDHKRGRNVMFRRDDNKRRTLRPPRHRHASFFELP